MQWTKQQKLLGCAVLAFAILLALSFFLMWRFQQKSKLTKQIQQTSYTQITNNSQWPLEYINNQLNSYLLRVVLDDEYVVDSFEYNGLIVRAWSYGSYFDARNNPQRIAIPRVWYNPTQQKLFFPTTIKTMDAPRYSEGFMLAILNDFKTYYATKQNLVAAYFVPNDPDADESLTAFFTSFQTTTLPDSFLLTGDPRDLPKAPKVGAFFPITQLTFDIEK